MKLAILNKHKFQFISFCYVYHPVKSDSGNIQLNSDSHLIHVCRGKGTITIGNRLYPIKAGNVVAVPQFTPFTMNICADFEMMNIHYRLWLKDDTLFEDIKTLPVIFTPPYFSWCREKLLKINNINQVSGPELPDAYAHEIILKHLTENQLADVSGPARDPRMQKVRVFLEYPKLYRFDAAALATVCHLSKSQMNRNFRKLFGVSPQKYWEKQRLKIICALLQRASVNIYEIAAEAGFEDSGYFCRWFKKMTGYTPSEYRNKIPINDAVI
ncbi:MAG: AraC family transcriptional regulator [Victivallaceae bacterium]|nr:AraC family transcriptional regulator [Victivallaceae bacterium]